MASSHTHSASHDADGHDGDHAGGHAHFAHATPVWQLFAVFMALIVLTILTVSTGMLGLGDWEIVASLGIAFVKATLVTLFFMHLLHDKPFNQMLMIFSLAFIALFIGFTAIDSQTYQPLVDAREEDKPFVAPKAPAGPADVPAGTAPGETTPEAAPAQTGDSEHSGQG